MDQSVDFGLPGGWHVTLFHPWVWMALAACALLALAAVAKWMFSR